MTTTHTYAILEVSKKTFEEIWEKLGTSRNAHKDGKDVLIDMHGIALRKEKQKIGIQTRTRRHRLDSVR